MKLTNLELSNFMIFNHLDMNFSPNINIISGENSTGKTALLKILYSCMKSGSKVCTAKGDVTKEKIESTLVGKLQGVFRPDKDSVGRLVNRRQGSNRADISLKMDTRYDLKFGFGNRQERHVEILNAEFPDMKNVTPVYLPPKEIISAMENFGALYDEYHIAFEETYYDLARLLEKPLRKGKNTAEQNKVMKSFEEIVNGSIVHANYA